MLIDEAEPGKPRSGSAQVLMKEMVIPLVGEDLKPLWLEHSELGGDMDVAVIALSNLIEELLVIPWDSAESQAPDDSWLHLAPGQDVMVLGYPTNWRRARDSHCGPGGRLLPTPQWAMRETTSPIRCS
jgi:hypothetical protein